MNNAGSAGAAPRDESTGEWFWDQRARESLPRLSERHFWWSRRPVPRESVFSMWARSPVRLAATLLGIGFMSVFLKQMDLVFQIVLGAPLFEEFFKFGLALVVVAWIPRGPTFWAALFPLRMIVALGAGAGFGYLEHISTYAEEDTTIFLWRVAFHAVTTALSMATYSIFEKSGDARIRWFAVLPAAMVHYFNNAAAVVLGLLSTVVPIIYEKVEYFSYAIVVTLVYALLSIPVWGRHARTYAEGQVGRWWGLPLTVLSAREMPPKLD